MPTLVVRSAGSAASLLNPLRNELQSVDKDILLSEIQLYTDIVSAGLLLPRFGTVLLAVFSGIGMVMAVIGLYGVLSFSTAMRTNEIGLRMALGSSRRNVLRLVILDGMKLSMTGILLGLGGAYAFSRVLTAVLVRVNPSDPQTFAIISLLLIGAAFCASYVPARKAADTDPVRALRHD